MKELTQVTQDFSLVPSAQKPLIEKAVALLQRAEPSETRMSEYQAKHFVTGQYPTPWRNYKQAVGEIEARLNVLVDLHYQSRLRQSQIHQWQWLLRWSLRLEYLCGWFKGVSGGASAKVAYWRCQERFTERDVQQKLKELKWYEEALESLHAQIDGHDPALLEQQSWEAEQVKKDHQEMSQAVQRVARLQMAKNMVQQEIKEGRNHGT